MEIQELYIILGKLTLHYSKIELLAATIAKEIGVTSDPYTFFARADSREKIRTMRKHTQNLTNEELRKSLLKWLSQLDSLRKERNSVTHSIILWDSQNNDDYVLFAYDIRNGELNRSVIGYDSDKFTQLEERLREVNNTGYEIFSAISRAGHLFQSPRL
ncbi:MAG: hypothetical protein K9J06_13690 [Flavobacteriales bacterium]|nr:hypothetical protein [Flavobacteriales bacterium]